MREGIKGVAFDLDGTLYPNYSLHIRLIPFIIKETRLVSAFGRAREIMRRRQKGNPSLLSDDFYKEQAEYAANILSAAPLPLQEKIERLIYRGWEPFFKKIKLYKNAAQTIDALRNAGYKLGLLSDFPPETKLKYLGIAHLWDTVMCSETFGALKPHPLPFIKLAQAMSLPPDKILYVGNSHPYDIAGASMAGMKTAWIRNPLFHGSGKKKPAADFLFSSYRQLHDFMLS
ncbi:MAG: HAD family hydrolase [Treponema sp.]|jgi:putative hydrolase of the HAD superfamily|nr:HAD family hydrolase [Treponema sp.]